MSGCASREFVLLFPLFQSFLVPLEVLLYKGLFCFFAVEVKNKTDLFVVDVS